MTKVRTPVTRLTDDSVYDGGDRAIIVTIKPRVVELRGKGLRDSVAIRYSDLYRLLVARNAKKG